MAHPSVPVPRPPTPGCHSNKTRAKFRARGTTRRGRGRPTAPSPSIRLCRRVSLNIQSKNNSIGNSGYYRHFSNLCSKGGLRFVFGSNTRSCQKTQRVRARVRGGEARRDPGHACVSVLACECLTGHALSSPHLCSKSLWVAPFFAAFAKAGKI